MDRRSFITTLIGGFAAASLGGVALAEAAPVKLAPEPTPPTGDGEVSAETKQGLDGADAEFSQYYYYRRPYRRYGYYRPYRRYGYYRPYRRYGYYRPRYYRPYRRRYYY